MKVLSVTQNGGICLHALRVYTGLVDDEADLANVPEDAAPGSFFHTAGYAQMWELSLDSEWVEVQ